MTNIPVAGLVNVIQGGVYYIQSYQFCGYYLRVASDRLKTVFIELHKCLFGMNYLEDWFTLYWYLNYLYILSM